VQFIARYVFFTTVMIVINGVIGLCFIIGSFKYYEITFSNEETNSAISVPPDLSTRILIMPNVMICTSAADFI
jgi:Ca2+:H+ antiporter